MDGNILEEFCISWENIDELQTSGAHRRDGFVFGDIENTPQVTVGNGLKPGCPTEIFDYKSPRWA
jgi:hypothetical protein